MCKSLYEGEWRLVQKWNLRMMADFSNVNGEV